MWTNQRYNSFTQLDGRIFCGLSVISISVCSFNTLTSSCSKFCFYSGHESRPCFLQEFPWSSSQHQHPVLESGFLTRCQRLGGFPPKIQSLWYVFQHILGHPWGNKWLCSPSSPNCPRFLRCTWDITPIDFRRFFLCFVSQKCHPLRHLPLVDLYFTPSSTEPPIVWTW